MNDEFAIMVSSYVLAWPMLAYIRNLHMLLHPLLQGSFMFFVHNVFVRDLKTLRDNSFFFFFLFSLNNELVSNHS